MAGSRVTRLPGETEGAWRERLWADQPGLPAGPLATSDASLDIGGARVTGAKASGRLPIVDVTLDLGGARAAAAEANGAVPVTFSPLA